MTRILLIALLLMPPAAAFGQTTLAEPPLKPGEGRSAAPADGPSGGRTADTGQTEGANEPAGANPALGPIDYPGLHQPGRISQETATIQRAWDEAPFDAGVAEYRHCPNCVYRIRVRELMVSTIVLPEDRVIRQVDIGDPVGFEIQARGGNMVVVRPRTIGIDTNMNLYTDRGIMSFYLRAEGFDSDHIPDLVVRIGPERILESPAVEPPSLGPLGPPAGEGTGPGTDLPALPESAIRGSVAGKDHGFDPAKLRGWGDYNLRGDNALRPETVFRDDHFTYVHFGDRWADLELPVAFVVIDGIDETVNTRVQGRTLVVESTAPLISLKSGEKYLCIEYQGGGA